MRKKTFYLLAMLVINVPLRALTLEKDTISVKDARNKSIYIELLGASNLIGISYDSRISPTSNWGYRLGISYFRSGSSPFSGSPSNDCIFFPLEINYLIGRKKSKLELGAGTSLGLYKENIYFLEYDKPEGEIKINSILQKTFGYYLFSNIGYRYQSNNSFLFRAGINPSFSFKGKHGIKREPLLYPYLSFGYSF